MPESVYSGHQITVSSFVRVCILTLTQSTLSDIVIWTLQYWPYLLFQLYNLSRTICVYESRVMEIMIGASERAFLTMKQLVMLECS